MRIIKKAKKLFNGLLGNPEFALAYGNHRYLKDCGCDDCDDYSCGCDVTQGCGCDDDDPPCDYCGCDDCNYGDCGCDD